MNSLLLCSHASERTVNVTMECVAQRRSSGWKKSVVSFVSEFLLLLPVSVINVQNNTHNIPEHYVIASISLPESENRIGGRLQVETLCSLSHQKHWMEEYTEIEADVNELFELPVAFLQLFAAG